MLRSPFTRRIRVKYLVKDGETCFLRRFSSHYGKPFTVLGIESSADDTCAAVVTSSREILSNVVIKQNHIHEQYGGIHPYLALHAHQRNMPVAIRSALSQAGITVHDLDGVAFTRGPGMGGGLTASLHAGKAIGAAIDKPIVGVHHMQAHALTPFLTATSEETTPKFPFLTLLVSGGHTLLLLSTSPTEFKILATSLDSSIGKAIDNAVKMLKLDWAGGSPGGALERYAQQYNGSEAEEIAAKYFYLPMPGRLAFAYACTNSQLKTLLQDRYGADLGGPTMPLSEASNSSIDMDVHEQSLVASAVQIAVFTQLENKIKRCLKWCQENNISGIRQLVVSGGVASNLFLRRRLDTLLSPLGVSQIFPPPHLCTDNAAMIAWASMHRFLAGDSDPLEVDIRPRWSIEDLNIGELDEALPGSEDTDASKSVTGPERFERKSKTNKRSRFNTEFWEERKGNLYNKLSTEISA